MDDGVASQLDIGVLHEQVADRIAKSMIFSSEHISGGSLILALVS